MRSRKIIGNFFFLTAGKTIGDFSTFILFVVISRLFGQEGTGQYSFAMAFTGFFVVFADFGLYSFGIKELSQHTESFSVYYGRLWILRIALSFLVLLALGISSPFLPFPNETKLIIVIIGVYQLMQRLSEGATAAFIAHEEMHLAGIMEAIFRTGAALIAIAIAYVSKGIVLALGALPVITALQFLTTDLIVRRRYGRLTLRLSISSMIRTLRAAVPFGLSMFLSQVQTRIDVLLLGFLVSTIASGVYNVGYRVIFLLFMFPNFASMVVLPLASKLYKESLTEFRSLYHQSIKVVVLIALPISAGVWLIAPDLIRIIFGEVFEESSSVLRILSGLLFFSFLNRLMMTFLAASDKQNDATRVQWFAVLLNLIGNLVLIPIFGVRGAAISTLISEGVFCVVLAVVLYPSMGVPQVGTRIAIGVMATIMFVVPFLLLPSTPLPLVVLASALIYAGTLIVFKEIRAQELQMVMSFFRKDS